ncbi:unnamed protein product [Calypogeia fissa]
MDVNKVNALWKCMVFPKNITSDDVYLIFIKSAITYVRGRYYKEEPEKFFAGQQIDEEEAEGGDGEKHLANSLKEETKVEEATGQDHGDMLKFSKYGKNN